ncbi:uncharacterized protein KRP23_4610 [Phytophthora ramorum]|uniref:uncharacterized protein n=1 Tax=Phytophthora ramorum TaxID=164328 RepID=UPI003095F8AB|nr:hypothetical protein KRP23_4610 [Phytophthora ramorum]
MLDTTDVVEDAPASQDAKTLVPMSLSLVAKKEKILQTEVAKLEKVLTQRNEVLCGLRESHEYLLTTNGQLQERSRLRREKLVALRMVLEADHERDGADELGLCDSIGMNELDATAEKCDVLKDILLGLTDKHTALEQSCMGLEERTALHTETLSVKREQLKQVQGTLLLLHEDIHSTRWNFENDQAELTEVNKRLNVVSQNSQSETATLEKIDAALRMEKVTVEDLQTVWQNCQDMVHEEHRQLAVMNEEVKSERRELQKSLESNGATCSADEAVLETAKDLQSRLQRLNEDVTSAKFFKRELALRRKQEIDMLAVTQSSIKAKDEQLAWLERQRVHLENECNEASTAQAADETAYQALLEEHKDAMAALGTQTKDAEKRIKITERAISARNKKVVAINKKVAQKTKVLAEWKARIGAKQEEVAKSAVTQELVDADALSAQEALNQELRLLERSQQLRAMQEMEAEELRSSCAALDTDTRRVHKTLAKTKNRITATQTAVKNRIDEIREKFLSSFVVADAQNLIELLNEEIESRRTRGAEEVNSAIATKGEMLKQRYDTVAADTRTKYSKILRQKERQHNTKLGKLRNLETEKNTAPSARMGEGDTVQPVSATGSRVDRNKESMTSEQVSEAESEAFDPPILQRRSSHGVPGKAPVAKKRSSKTKPTQQKAPVVAKHTLPKRAPKSARRQLAPGLNLVDESPRTDNELTDIFTANAAAGSRSLYSEGGARRPRLKRRTPAQKAWKTAIAVRNHPGPTRVASATPEVIAPVTIASASSSTQLDPAGGMSSRDPLGSPVGCDENLGVTLDGNKVNPVKTVSGAEAPSLSSQTAAKKQQLPKVGQRNKGTAKRRTSTKVSHRSRHVKKIGHLSLARSTADWSAADSFSFN